MRRARSGRSAGAMFPVGLLLATLLLPTGGHGGQTPEPVGEPSAEAIEQLIARLGDADYQARESAAAALKSIGAAAVDPLLAAAELDGDLEVALRARWLVDAIPLAMPHDPPEVARLLDAYKRRDFSHRVRVMHRLLRVDDDAGIEALARIVRLERDPAGSRVAAALLTREWRPDDPWWPGMAARCSVGLGGSRRPAANFVRAVVDFSSADTAGQRDVAIEAATTALAAIDHSADEERPRAPDDEDDADFDGTAPKSDGSTETARIFERGRIRMLLAADRRDEALAAATRLLEGSWTGVAAKEAVSPVIETLTWATELGLAPIVERLHAARPDLVSAEPLVTYAAAAAERARGDAARATTLADAAFARQNDPAQPPVRSERMQAAMLLARWGCVEWAVRGYTAILDDTRTQPAEYALTAIIGAEYLHELDRDTEAAAFMGRLLGPDGGRKDLNAEQILAQLGRDHRTSLARMHYFSACVAGRRGDTAEQRRLLETALRSLGKDIDSLIALYHLPDNTPDQRGDALRRINEALRQIDNEIQGMPEEANGYNEYAWLVANTVGDVEKATRYSKQSLVKSFDNSSYLDTLAHCRAAAGDLSGAIRWQSLAHRHEPHNTTIRRNLDRFEAMAAAAKQP